MGVTPEIIKNPSFLFFHFIAYLPLFVSKGSAGCQPVIFFSYIVMNFVGCVLQFLNDKFLLWGS